METGSRRLAAAAAVAAAALWSLLSAVLPLCVCAISPEQVQLTVIQTP